ncbi:putative helix-loop-helix DNA-binding domain superfamily [Helianthus annuus]|uniref:Helix-loop-helix DNA-binding domain superfamily n=1 Tax=Helianthus annuus TaxID=4232 RepID=A0A9K3H8K7_HELAN|nr:putative helix-loop-helix DNA-binding domain superfamily [Helianthus annuus]KAJ0464869.1 putative helix-loop-helix DNA-binding domain superfamily, transcription factor IBH1 [Helianthus annuus]KAJ0469562.1 putative helix-loop-helix DNA-binding domain superfamily [Helianthus annuus]KAJ0486460.1 putative helix-loop-helix DNA-binding domain superfamily, transcription factor IBH1 [Helianthus annuus]KAJ0657025.1 putative helix-loop-helix DNA-binding domain superfamily, transcription factor IBH1 [H
MGSTPRRLKNIPAKKVPPSSHYKKSKPQHNKPTITRTSSVSDKLEALKNLIPTQEIDDTSSADKLFKETADYILLLRTQVSILQKLVDFYGSSSSSSSLVQQ